MPYDFSLPAELWNELIAAMRQTMYAAPGVGLAAPQIGLGIRVAVLEDPAQIPVEIAVERQRYPTPLRVLVNPVYESVAESSVDRDDNGAIAVRVADFYEGCLSVPGYQAVVRRATSVQLRCLDENGRSVDEFINGWAARIVAHETDHLDGILYLDRAMTRSLATTENLTDRYSGLPMQAIREALGF